jgi:ribosomal protein L11 methyltransferase
VSGSRSPHSAGDSDLALRVIVAKPWAEMVGAVLMERLGCYAEEPAGVDTVALVFYPQAAGMPSDVDLLSLLPEEARAGGRVRVERQAVPRDWVDGWKDHFHPSVIGGVRVRPPWESAQEGSALVDVVINPGLGFGTGLHPTTRGALTLLQQGDSAAHPPVGSRGPLVDVGTGSGILSVAASKLGWGPVIAFDDDGVALISARENVAENGVADLVKVYELGLAEAPSDWFAGVTVLANMTLGPLLTLVRRLVEAPPSRLVAAGILAGAQEEEFASESLRCGFSRARLLYEAEWVSMELLPIETTVGSLSAAPAREA